MGKIPTERRVDFVRKDVARQIVYGEVYVPGRRDTDGNWMTAETVEKMAHRFMANLRNQNISKAHDGMNDKGAVVESFIAREGDPDFPAGAWVVGVHIPDTQVWKQVTDGVLTGFSVEGTATLIKE